VNPYGPSLPAFLVQDMLRDRPISEWASIPLFDLSNAHFKAAVLLAIGGLLLRRERRLWEVAIVAATAAAAFRHERHMPLFAILAAPYLGETLGLLAARLRQRIVGGAFSVGATASVSVGALAIAAVQLVSTVRIHHATHGNIFVAPEEFPVHAVRFIRENGLRGNLAVPFDWGEYAIWHLYPDCRVSIDGRYTTAYPSNVIDSGWRFIDGSPGWDALLQDASVALVDRRHGTALRLFSSPQWRLAYLDPTAIIFVRKIRDDLPVRVARAADDGSRPAIFFP
jgi:hypothetical protein